MSGRLKKADISRMFPYPRTGRSGTEEQDLQGSPQFRSVSSKTINENCLGVISANHRQIALCLRILSLRQVTLADIVFVDIRTICTKRCGRYNLSN